MNLRFEIRCLHCQSDELDCRTENEALDCMSRAHVRCRRCGRTYRVSVTMVAVKKDRTDAPA